MLVCSATLIWTDFHVVAVPGRFEEGIAEAEGEQVLDRLLAQVVVDAVDLRFVEILVHQRVQLDRGVEVVPEGFLDHQARPALAAVQPRLAQRLDGPFERSRRKGEVQDAVAARAFSLKGFDARGKRLEILGDGHVDRLVMQALVAPVRVGGRQAQLAERFARPGAELLVVQRLVARHAEDLAVPRQGAVLLHAKERGQQFLAHEVARAAEDHEDAGIARGLLHFDRSLTGSHRAILLPAPDAGLSAPCLSAVNRASGAAPGARLCDRHCKGGSVEIGVPPDSRANPERRPYAPSPTVYCFRPAPMTVQAACKDAPKAGVDWNGCEKQRLMLGKADLKGARIVGAELDGTDLANANLAGADLSRASLDRVRLSGADLGGREAGGSDRLSGKPERGQARRCGPHQGGADPLEPEVCRSYQREPREGRVSRAPRSKARR